MRNSSTQSQRRFALGSLIGALVFALSLAPLPNSAAAADQGAAVLTKQVPTAGSKIASGRAVVVVDKPIDEVMTVLVDYGRYVEFMPNFTRSKVLAQRGNKAMVYMEVSLAKGMYTLYGQLKLAERPQAGESRVVEGSLVDGNINAFDATFTLTPINDGASTEIVFNIYVDPDLPLPSSVFSRENERAAGRAMRALRERIVETGA